MNFAIKLTLDDLTRALRTTAHTLADNVEQRQRAERIASGARLPARKRPSAKEETRDDFARR